MERPFDESAALAEQIARDVIGDDMPLGTWLQRARTAEGEEAIQLVVMLPDARAGEVKGEQLITIMRRIGEALREQGETRLPLVSFARMRDQPELERARSGAPA